MSTTMEWRRVLYAEAPTKFYRVGVVLAYDSVGGTRYFTVFNWGSGTAMNNVMWGIGAYQTREFPTMAMAQGSAANKMRSKLIKEYTAMDAWQFNVAIPGEVPDHVKNLLVKNHGLPRHGAGQAVPQKVHPTPKITITTATGGLKPALAKRTVWHAQE